MNTNNVLLEYTIPVIKDMILEYAFKYIHKKELFELGYYERCVEILDEIFHLDYIKYIKPEAFVQLLDGLFFKSCKGGHMKLTKLLIKRKRDRQAKFI